MIILSNINELDNYYINFISIINKNIFILSPIKYLLSYNTTIRIENIFFPYIIITHVTYNKVILREAKNINI